MYFELDNNVAMLMGYTVIAALAVKLIIAGIKSK